MPLAAARAEPMPKVMAMTRLTLTPWPRAAPGLPPTANTWLPKVVRERIEDQVNNFTRFLVIGKKLAVGSGDDKTSLMFSVKDEVGILYRMLEPFSKRGINLSKIESRPLKKKAWEYIFFLDLAGHISDQDVADAVQELKGCCQFVKVLGSYPRGK